MPMKKIEYNMLWYDLIFTLFSARKQTLIQDKIIWYNAIQYTK
jgi:hypothetical protein